MDASVILPVYNQLNRLKLVLNGYNMQKVDGTFEVIVIDDGSMESIEQYIVNQSYKFELVYKKLEKNNGRSVARNVGAQIARADILIFNDGDRIPSVNFVQEHVSFQKNINSEKVVVGKIVELFVNENSINECSSFNSVQDLTSNIRDFNYYDFIEQIYDERGRTSCNVVWLSFFSGNCSISKELFWKVGGFDEKFTTWGFENFEIGYRLASAGAKYYLNRKAVNFHLFHSYNRIGENRDEAYKLFCQLHPCKEIKELLNFLDGKVSLEYIENLAASTDKLSETENLFRASKFGRKYYFEENI